MSESENDFNLEDLEAMSQEGLEHFGDDKALDSIQSEVMRKIEQRVADGGIEGEKNMSEDSNTSIGSTTKQDIQIYERDINKAEIKKAKGEIWKLLLVLALVLGLCYLLFTMLGGEDTNKQLYASNYDSPPFLLSSTERSGNSDSAKISGIKNLYSQKDYAACLTAIEANDAFALREYPDLALYKGICLLEEGKAKEASVILKNPSIDIEDVRLWYLAMAHLSSGEKAECIKVLESLTSLDSNYKNEAARTLIEELKK